MRHGGKYFKTLIKNYMILPVILTVCVGVVFASLNIANLQKQSKIEIKFSLQQRAQSMETRFKTAGVLFNGLMCSGSLDNYIKMMNGTLSSEKHGLALLELVNELKSEQAVWSAIDVQPAVTLSDSDTVVTIDGTLSAADYADKYCLSLINSDDVAERLGRVKNEYRSRWYITKNEKGDIVVITGNKVNKEYVYFIEILPVGETSESNRYGGDFFLMSNDEVLVSEKDIDEGYFDGFNKAVSALLNANEPIRWKNSDFYALESGVIPGVYYVCRQDTAKYMRNTYLIALEGVLLSFVLVLFGIWFVFKKTKSVYEPIENVIETFKDYNDTSAADEMAFLHTTAKNIMSDNVNYRHELQQSRTIVKNQFLIDWICGVLTENEITEKIAEYDLLSLKGGCRVVIMKQTEHDYQKLLNVREELLIMLKDNVNNKYFGEIFEKEPGTIILLLPVENENEIKRAMNDLACEASNSFELEFAISIGSFEKQLQNMRKSFENALVLNEMRNSADSRKLLTMKEFEKPNVIKYVYPLEIERSLISTVVSGERKHAERIFKNIIERNIKEQEIDSYSLFEFELLVLATMRRILQLVNISEHKVFGGEALLPEKMGARPEEVAKKLEYIFGKIADAVCKEDDDVSVKLANILNYIENNYSKDIGRGDVAREFNISESYVGKLFSEKLGSNFKSYLNRLRISKAKEIICSNKNIKMSELPEMVGYNNSVSFLRVFKKYVGMSPTEFQNSEENKIKRSMMK